MTTIDTLTDNQILGLARESAEGGDLAQVAICRRAVDELEPNADVPPSARIGDDEAVAAALRMTVQDARVECLRVITDAEAMLDEVE